MKTRRHPGLQRPSLPTHEGQPARGHREHEPHMYKYTAEAWKASDLLEVTQLKVTVVPLDSHECLEREVLVVYRALPCLSRHRAGRVLLYQMCLQKQGWGRKCV